VFFDQRNTAAFRCTAAHANVNGQAENEENDAQNTNYKPDWHQQNDEDDFDALATSITQTHVLGSEMSGAPS